jgi:Putative peptidoglycan binding domain
VSTPDQIVAIALSQVGKQYGEGGNWSASDESPPFFDCSEFTEWVCLRAGAPLRLAEASYLQYWQCRNANTMLSLNTGIATKGSLLFNFRSNGVPIEPPSSASKIGSIPGLSRHVAFSLGDGRCVGAQNSVVDVALSSASSANFSHAALVPGVDYAGVTGGGGNSGGGGGALPPPSPPSGPRGPKFRRRTDLPSIARGSGDVTRVKELQFLLISLGDAELGSFGATGKFGNVTDRAVRRFQQRVKAEEQPGMVVDGVVGPTTWGWLFAYAT